MKKGAILAKKHIVLALLVVALGVAVYLNFLLVPTDTVTGGDTINDTSSSDKNLGDSKYVDNNVDGNDESKVSVDAKVEDDFFKNARADREKAHDDALDVLKEITANAAIDGDAKEKATAGATQLSKNIEKENAIETLLKAKGYTDAVAIISDENVTVIVRAETLLDSQTLQIQDIVVSQTKASLENITITPKK